MYKPLHFYFIFYKYGKNGMVYLVNNNNITNKEGKNEKTNELFGNGSSIGVDSSECGLRRNC